MFYLYYPSMKENYNEKMMNKFRYIYYRKIAMKIQHAIDSRKQAVTFDESFDCSDFDEKELQEVNG